jgi:5-methylcytosine-specific restriction endonuclease McrA
LRSLILRGDKPRFWDKFLEYEHYGKFSTVLIPRRCGSWKAAIQRAGLTVSPLYHERATSEQLFENLEHLWESLGRQPRRADFVKPLSTYSSDVYANRFGSFRKALEAFVASFESHEPERFEKPTQETTVDSQPMAALKRHRTSRTISWRMRFLVMRRDDFKCRACGTSPAMKPGIVLVVDHISPWVGGGETVMENLQTLCEPCNGGKSDLPMTASET